MTHLEQRLQERGIQMTQSQLDAIAEQCSKDTAVILSRGKFYGTGQSADYYNRRSSNGDVVILIVRGKRAVTIMYRRSNQSMRPADMNVHNVLDISRRSIK